MWQKVSLPLLPLPLLLLFLAYKQWDKHRQIHPDFKASFLGSSLTCSSQDKQPERVTVPRPFAKRAKLKARLLNLLHESLYDDSKGIVNVTREKEIVDLAKKLKDEKGD